MVGMVLQNSPFYICTFVELLCDGSGSGTYNRKESVERWVDVVLRCIYVFTVRNFSVENFTEETLQLETLQCEYRKKN